MTLEDRILNLGKEKYPNLGLLIDKSVKDNGCSTTLDIIRISIAETLKEVEAKLRKRKHECQLDLTRLASEMCPTRQKAIEQRVKIDQVHVMICHFDEILEELKEVKI